MDKEDVEGILGNTYTSTSSAASRSDSKKPPANPIIPKRIADKWDSQISGLIVDMDASLSKQNAIYEEIRSAFRWMLIRDIIIILLLVVIGVIVGFNTHRLWWGLGGFG